MEDKLKNELFELLKVIYSDYNKALYGLKKLQEKTKNLEPVNKNAGWVTQKDTMLITYGDSIKKDGEAPLKTLHNFLKSYVKDSISSVHLLPMYPYTSDDGFSVVDYLKINPELGDWEDVRNLSEDYKLMFDAVINHISQKSKWFQSYLNGDNDYKNYFIESDPEADYHMVTRPRALPLLTEVDTENGKKYVWTTFSEDQIDLNYQNPDVLADIAEILLYYAYNGAKYIRLDAIGFLWKEMGTTCMHLKQTHAVIQLYRKLFDYYVPGTVIITETNVPHQDNISYFGDGTNEAQMVYQFPLPPLTLYSFVRQDAKKLNAWAASLGENKQGTTYFNFLASHDGIGLRPTEGILSDEERQMLVENVLRNGGRVSYKNNPDGTQSPYELNINYQDALTSPNDKDSVREKRFLSAQTVLLSMIGVPGIYVHSLLGSRNDYYGVEISGINRRINREKLNYDRLANELETDTARRNIFNEMLRRIRIRSEHTAFSPEADQKVVFLNDQVFSILRTNKKTKEEILCLINVSEKNIELQTEYSGYDLLFEKNENRIIELKPLDAKWILLEENK